MPSISSDSAPPAWAVDLPAQLECEADPQQLGAVVGDTAHGMTDAPDPAGALNNWIAEEAPLYVVLPLGGYREVQLAEHWTLFAHQVEGSPKVVVLVSDIGAIPWIGHWTATSFAACDAAEFDPSVPLGYDIKVWSDRDGRVSTRRLLERQDCYGARVMRVESKLFVQDPTGNAFESEYLLTTYDPDVPLPASALVTDFVEGERRLYVGVDGSAAFIESPTGVERWPRVRGDEYVRIDCN